MMMDSRQMPSISAITHEKDYCDLLYAWLQIHSEVVDVGTYERKIAKKEVKWSAIERDFTRTSIDGSVDKVMGRKTIAKYFEFLIQKGLVYDKGDEYYYLQLLNTYEANLIEFYTLMKMMNVF